MLGKIRARGKAVVEAGDRGLFLAGRNVLNVSNRQVPHEEGDLERDGAVVQGGAGEPVSITYGRSADTKDYAVKQHEDMSLRHDSGRNAKFLENALNSERETSLQIIAAQTAKAWTGG